MENFPALLDWLRKANLLSREETIDYEEKWGVTKTKEAFSVAIALRCDLLSIIQKYKKGEQIPENLLEHINVLLRDQVFTSKLVMKDNTFIRESHREIEQPLDLLIPIAKGAIDLFSQNKMHLIKKCENPDCVLYFYDNSKNSRRRWCSQITCGNRMKVTAYLDRRREKND
ncbi:CGNR zinc finger domain-containing protein [Paenibacillus sp. TAF58]